MCDFSLHNVRSRPASVGDKLVTHSFGAGTRGFAAIEDHELAVCLLPGTELAFADNIKVLPYGLLRLETATTSHQHHDAIEFPDGRIELLTMLHEDQAVTVLQLPAEPKSTAEAVAQERAAYVG